jgi:hypothetical protein
MLASPLMAGNDLQNMTPETKSILLNKEMIAINQDSLGRQATCYRDNGNYQIWVKTLSNNEKAVCLINTSDEKKSVLVDFSLLASIRGGGRGFGGPPPAAPAGGTPGMPGVPGAAGAQRTQGAQGVATAGQAVPAAGQGMPGGMGPGGPGGQRGFTPMTLENYKIRDIWEHKDLLLKETSMYVELLPHSVKVYRFVRK